MELDLHGESNMRLIAHRGLFQGPSKDLENNPQQISLALSKNFDCEIDVWYVDQQWMLGHDAPTYTVDYDFICQLGLWIHAKNLEALHRLSKDRNLTYFWHQNDDFTLTSSNHIWTYSGKPLTSNSISVMPEWHDPNFEKIFSIPCFGICSDYIEKIKFLYDRY